jgi:hypothetical protein
MFFAVLATNNNNIYASNLSNGITDTPQFRKPASRKESSRSTANASIMKPKTLQLVVRDCHRIDEEDEVDDDPENETSIVEEHRTFIRIGTIHKTKSMKRTLRRVRSYPRSYRNKLIAG